jgi:hypothetical protein
MQDLTPERHSRLGWVAGPDGNPIEPAQRRSDSIDGAK